MFEQWHKVELLSDVVVTSDSATAGGHQALDYLPGSLFLGVAAAHGDFDADLLLSGRVRFLDALPMVDDTVAFPVPLAFHAFKGQDWKGHRPLNLLTTVHDDRQLQPKQWRTGYMTANGQVVFVARNSRMKTAIDRGQRRASEGQLFGYESICAGTTFLMRIQCDRQEDWQAVENRLRETVRLGRSRSAEYGRARMTRLGAPVLPAPMAHGNMIAIYLLSDLALQRNGQPVCVPRPEDFHLPTTARLVPEKCFIKKRIYTPWNAFFNCRMMERHVLCKGSALCFEMDTEYDPATLQAALAKGVGMHREEGLGQVLVNPPWLLEPPLLTEALPGSFAKAVRPKTLLADYLETKAQRRENTILALKHGLLWARKWHTLSGKIAAEWGGDRVPGKTQWANIREIAIRCLSQPDQLHQNLNDFCARGLRRKDWVEAEVRGAGNLLDAVLQRVGNNPDALACLTLYHAAVEMGRILARPDNPHGKR